MRKIIKERELVRDNSDKEMERKTYRTSIVETDDKVVEYLVTEGKYLTTLVGCWKKGETWTRRSTVTQQKFLCVNGPLVGQKVTEAIAAQQGYHSYNFAGFSRSNRNKKFPKVVLVCL